ncbi:MAG: hypothetical protein P4L84_28780 [Isosphaeraceae bacterium]|nr:hypothetical protein [Isosphaeraceae bacterium]
MFGWFKEKPPRPNGPDFSTIDSREKAVKLFERGDLEKLFLMPLEFGGEDNALNTLFVPVGLAGVKAGIDGNVVAPLAADGKITRYKAMPEYQGRSVIPIAIKIEASDPGSFTATINIWGEALARENGA